MTQWAWVASALATLGAVMDALNLRISRYRFVCYLIANVICIAYVVRLRSHPLLWQFSIMTGSSVIGLWRWRRKASRRRAMAEVRFATEPPARAWAVDRLLRRKTWLGSRQRKSMRFGA
jgi:hypothetical protein